MTSSTSSSDNPKNPKLNARKRTTLAITLALIGMLALEGLSRAVLIRSSKDFSRFMTYPESTRTFMSTPGRHVVFVGNSYTGEGIDEDEFSNTISNGEASPIHAAKLTADSSYSTTWYYMLKHYFWNRSMPPDMAVFNFQTSWLQDGKNEEIGRLALAFTSRRDWRELLSRDLMTIGDRAEYLVSSYWVTYGIRDRIRERFLSLLVPGYREYVSSVHNSNRRFVSGNTKASPTYNSLDRLIKHAQSRGTQVCFIAGPAIQPYQIDTRLLQLFSRNGAIFLDLRSTPEISRQSFRDGIHLTKEGRLAYTRRVAQELAQHLHPRKLAANPTPR